MKKIFQELLNFYPDRIVFGLQNHQKLYKQLKKEAEYDGFISLDEYLKHNKFYYKADIYIYAKEEQVKMELAEKFPDGIVSDIRKSYLYFMIRDVALYHGFSINDYLESINYKYVRRVLKSAVDQFSAIRLKNSFGLTLKEIGDYAGVSKQQVDQVIKSGSKASSWIPEVFDEEVKEVFKNMILEHSYIDYDDEDNKYVIKNNNNGEFFLLWTTDDKVNCVFNDNVPNDLLLLCKETGMNRFITKDYQLLEISKIVYILKKPYLMLADDLAKTVYTKAKRLHKMKSKEYCNFLGFEGFCDTKDNTDERLIQIFEENLIEGKVNII